MVGFAEDGAENSEGGSVVEDRAESNGGWLDGWEICWDWMLVDWMRG